MMKRRPMLAALMTAPMSLLSCTLAGTSRSRAARWR
jgi:hypothetical protein